MRTFLYVPRLLQGCLFGIYSILAHMIQVIQSDKTGTGLPSSQPAPTRATISAPQQSAPQSRTEAVPSPSLPPQATDIKATTHAVALPATLAAYHPATSPFTGAAAKVIPHPLKCVSSCASIQLC